MYRIVDKKGVKITLLGEYLPCIKAAVTLEHGASRAEEPSCWSSRMLAMVRDKARLALYPNTLSQLRQISTCPLKNVMLNSWLENDEISVLSQRRILKNEPDCDKVSNLPRKKFSSSSTCVLRGLRYPEHMKPLR